MAPERRGDRLTPEQVSRLTFTTSFRGFDPDQVRQFLALVAEELREQRDREAALRTDLEALHARAATDAAPLDEDALTAALGEETARVLTAAREAAQQIRTKGEESVARMLREAQDEAARVRAAAEEVLGEKTTAAEATAAELIAAAEEHAAKVGADADAASHMTRVEADAVLAAAQADADRTKTEAVAAAASELERARDEGRTMVHEAQVVRERVLKDLARKRKTARAQLEQLRAGRERLLEAYELVRRTLGEATGELSVALTEAKIAADAAVRRVDEEPEPTLEELEAEVEAAKLVGLPLLARAPEAEADEATFAAAESPSGTEPSSDVLSSASSDVTSEAPTPSEPPAARAIDAAQPSPEVDETRSSDDAAPPPESAAAAGADGATEPRPSTNGTAVPADELPPLPDEIPPPPPTLDPIRPPRKGRRKRGVPELPPTELQPMSPRDPVEGMRVITGEVPAVPTSAAAESASTEESAPQAVTSSASETVADAEAPVQPEAGDEADATAASAPSALGATETASPEAAANGAPVGDADLPSLVSEAANGAAVDAASTNAAAEAETTAAATDAEITAETEAVNVDDLFARIRAARADEVAKANEVLDSAAPHESAAATDAVTVEEEEPSATADETAPEDDETLLERRDALVDAIEQAATRKLKRVLADEQSEVLDRLRRTRKATIDALYVEGIEAQLARWSTAVEPDLEEAARGGAAFHGGHDASPRPTFDLAADLAAELVHPLRGKVEVALREADGDEEAAADGIRSAYREWKAKRIADHTRDAVFGAFGRGLHDALDAGATTRWIVDDGGVPCPDCDDDALAGGVAKGAPFPTGHCHPPAHPGCRCLLVHT